MLTPVESVTSINPDVLDRQCAQRLYVRHSSDSRDGRARGDLWQSSTSGRAEVFRLHDRLPLLQTLGVGVAAFGLGLAGSSRDRREAHGCGQDEGGETHGAELYEYLCWMSETCV